MAKRRSKFFETRYFAFVIGLVLFLAFFAVGTWTVWLEGLELAAFDSHFKLKENIQQSSSQVGAESTTRSHRISEDILIIGVDFNSLSRYGRWPFPRWRHADLVNAFSRITDQANRERALFIDVFFIDPDRVVEDDAALVDAIADSGRVFLETVLTDTPAGIVDQHVLSERQAILYEGWGTIRNVRGDWKSMREFLGYEPPLPDYAAAVKGYGHANFIADLDDVYRRQPLVLKSSELIEELLLDDLAPGYDVNAAAFERLSWTDTDGLTHDVKLPLTARELERLVEDMTENAPVVIEDIDGDGAADRSYHVLQRYRDFFVPSITLSLALDYFGKTLDDLVVEIGKEIVISAPMKWDADESAWLPYRVLVKPGVWNEGELIEEEIYRAVPEIRIPIDGQGRMLVNFMGRPSADSPDGVQTFPVRSYAGYADKAPPADPETWRRPTMAAKGKILMVGAFARGVAQDEKPTPYGLMYGIEMHANALNTIIMDNFLRYAPAWLDALVLFAIIMLTSLYSSRISTVWSFFLTLFLVFALFIGITLTFDYRQTVFAYASPALGSVFAFIAIVAYRAFTEERDKRMIRDTFGKYVSPRVVDQLVESPPELGGVDKELTVFFSDIRGFTTFSENMSPQELVNHLNVYLGAMTDLVLEYGGTLDKYIGDAVMAFWGAPLPQKDHAVLACKCALRQMEKLRELNAAWPEHKRINIGIGLNSGIMTVGNMGSKIRMNYTLTGDNVNIGSRLEATNKEYGTNIILSESTYALVKDKFLVRELDNIRVKGKNKPVVIYELVDCLESLDPPASLVDDVKRK